jgi:hypothetical protein
MSHPIQFIDYACGHAAPVRGAGASVSRACQSCTEASAPGRLSREAYPDLARILGSKRPVYEDRVMKFPVPPVHPGPYCDCDMCQSRIP